MNSPVEVPARPNKGAAAALVFALSLLFALPVNAAELTARVDRAEISEDETLTLVLELTGKASGEAPDLGRLEKNFEVLSQRQSSQTSYVNGTLSRSKTWTYTLAPRRTGTLLIPQLRSGNKTSNSLQIVVTEARPIDTLGALPNFFVEGEVSSEKVYVQQQIIYTFRVSSAIGMRDAQFSEPLAVENAIVEELDENRYNKQIDGRFYQVIEQRYAIFPQRSGTLRIPSLQLNATLSTGRQSVFDRGQLVRKKTEEIDVTVMPPNPAFTGPVWLPAKTLSLSDTWSADPGKLTEGESITRDITAQATGLLASQLPPLDQPKIQGLKIYADQPQIENSKVAANILGQRIESMAMLVNTAGEIELPDIEVPWWNTDKNRMEIAVLKGTTLKVTADPASQQSSVAAGTAADSSAAPRPDADSPAEHTPPPAPAQPTWVWILIAGLTLAWLISTMAWLRARGQNSKPRVSTGSTVTIDDAAKAVESACRKKDASRLRGALLSWGKLRFGARCAALADLGLFLPEIKHALMQLDGALFGAGGDEVDYAAIAKAISEQRAKANDSQALKALYTR